MGLYNIRIRDGDVVLGFAWHLSREYVLSEITHLYYSSKASATNENLTSENWELILSVCDRVSRSPPEG